jgi:hypothetical protein
VLFGNLNLFRGLHRYGLLATLSVDRGTERSPVGWSVNKILERGGRKMWWLNLVESNIFATVFSIKNFTVI